MTTNLSRDLSSLSASEAGVLMRAGHLSAQTLLRACLDRIAAREPAVRAWAHVAEAEAMAAAAACDAVAPLSPLHGIPIGIKDVLDTADMPTAYGSPAFAGHQPAADARCVTLLREAGAIIIGKTVTAEFATYHPGPTSNPLDAGRTPGGSSSGSAAAVADRHVPLSLGTQTVGSTLRPGSFCGIHGFKPSIGRYPTDGTKTTSPTLDTIGIFSRSLPDLLLIDAVLAPAPAPLPVPSGEAIVITRTAAWGHATPAMQQALESCAKALSAAGIPVIERALPAEVEALLDYQTVIHRREVFVSLGHIRDRYPDSVSAAFSALVDAGAAITDADYAEAIAGLAAARAALPRLFEGAAALLSPAAPGIAPKGLDSTGDPIFSRIWTAIGTPCLGFPWGTDEGMPLGLQLIGPVHTDRRLIALTQELLAKINPA